jgi:hypothetical protein
MSFAISSLHLFLGAKTPFLEAPHSRLLSTSHWPKLGPCLCQKRQKRVGLHVCFNQSEFTYVWGVTIGENKKGQIPASIQVSKSPADFLGDSVFKKDHGEIQAEGGQRGAWFRSGSVGGRRPGVQYWLWVKTTFFTVMKRSGLHPGGWG